MGGWKMTFITAVGVFLVIIGVAGASYIMGKWSMNLPDENIRYTPMQLCPKCGGQGFVYKPPYIPGDQNAWFGTGPFTCDVCSGAGIIPMHVEIDEDDDD
jgi:hypothetical protein